ncbi:MAG TPA: hypothetical protein VK470_01400 [Bacteroidota bacterium]|nr:hypothetical protein [Bacteroidota bacterium]
MSYKIRNTIVLGVLLLLVAAVGIYITVFYQPRKITAYNKETKKIEAQLRDDLEQRHAIATLESTLRETVLRWENRTKEFAGSDAASETYAFLSDAMDESGAKNLKVNVTFSGTKAVSNKINYNTYKISGVSEFANIFRFIWLIENGRRLYKINNLTLKAEEDQMSEFNGIRMVFDFELQSYFTNESALSQSVMRPDSMPQPITSNAFLPLIFTRVPANLRNLVDPENLLVKAVSAGRALVQTPQGRLIVLKPGMDVYLGKVLSINSSEGSITFSLNKGGIAETKKMFIVFEKKQRGLNQ